MSGKIVTVGLAAASIFCFSVVGAILLDERDRKESIETTRLANEIAHRRKQFNNPLTFEAAEKVHKFGFPPEERWITGAGGERFNLTLYERNLAIVTPFCKENHRYWREHLDWYPPGTPQDVEIAEKEPSKEPKESRT